MTGTQRSHSRSEYVQRRVEVVFLVAMAAVQIALLVYSWFSRNFALGAAAATVLVILALVLAWERFQSRFPAPKHLRLVDDRVAWYPTASFTVPTVKVLKICIPISFAALALTCYPKVLMLVWNLSPTGANVIVGAFAFTQISLSAAVGIPFILGLGSAEPRRVVGGRHPRVEFLALGHCEAELITDGEVKAPGFRELDSASVRVSGERLRVRVGYFPRGRHEVRVGDAGFLFLRTRGFCLLYDSRGLPEDRKRVFKLARRWEKFSMVCAALRLGKGSDLDVDSVKELLKEIENNACIGFSVVYFGVKLSLATSYLGVAVFCYYLAPIIAGAFALTLPKGLRIALARPLMIAAGLLLALATVAVVTPILDYCNRKVVESGKMYRLPFERDRIQKLTSRESTRARREDPTAAFAVVKVFRMLLKGDEREECRPEDEGPSERGETGPGD